MGNSKSTHSTLFVVFSVLFVSLLLVSNVVAGKLALFGGIFLPSAVVLFPLTYIAGDILTEVYGFVRARLVIWMGFGANIVMSLIFLLVVALPFPDFFKGQDAYATVLAFVPRVVIASLVGYLVGEFLNSVVLSALKKATKGKHLWTRTIGSTIVGQGADTVLFILIAFTGTVPDAVLGSILLNQYLFKVAYEVILTPVTYLIVRSVKRYEGMDTFDNGIAYNPFSFRVKT